MRANVPNTKNAQPEPDIRKRVILQLGSSKRVRLRPIDHTSNRRGPLNEVRAVICMFNRKRDPGRIDNRINDHLKSNRIAGTEYPVELGRSVGSGDTRYKFVKNNKHPLAHNASAPDPAQFHTLGVA
jgi:hypothetical protein